MAEEYVQLPESAGTNWRLWGGILICLVATLCFPYILFLFGKSKIDRRGILHGEYAIEQLDMDLKFEMVIERDNNEKIIDAYMLMLTIDDDMYVCAVETEKNTYVLVKRDEAEENGKVTDAFKWQCKRMGDGQYKLYLLLPRSFITVQGENGRVEQKEISGNARLKEYYLRKPRSRRVRQQSETIQQQDTALPEGILDGVELTSDKEAAGLKLDCSMNTNWNNLTSTLDAIFLNNDSILRSSDDLGQSVLE